MPTFTLIARAKLDGVASLAADETFKLRVQLQCTRCLEAAPKVSVFGFDDKEEVPGSRGEANLVQSCKNCKETMTVVIVSKPSELKLTAQDAADGAPIAVLECRQCEPLAWQPGDGWTATGPSGQAWGPLDFNKEPEFTEYDETAEAAVEVSGLGGSFVAGSASAAKKR